MVRVIRHKPMNWVERLYIFEAFRGLFTTLKHFLRGFFRYETLPTVPYPDMKPEIRRTYRAKHRMMLRPDGTPRCVACFMCATACPAHCIYIEPAQSEDGRIEKRVLVTSIAPLQMFVIRCFSTATTITIPKSERVMANTRFLRSASEKKKRRDDF